MLELNLAGTSEYEPAKLYLEHSLVSVSKWEAFYEKAFYAEKEKTSEESLMYISLMVLNKTPPEDFLNRLTQSDFTQIMEYINKRQSATWFREAVQENSREVTTAELIYHWMIELEVPTEFQYWPINRLFIFIKVRSIKKTKEKPMSAEQRRQEYQRLNALRRQQTGSAG